LFWQGGPGFVGTGVSPSVGQPGTRYKFRVTYQDAAGDLPIQAEVAIRRDGKVVFRRAMTAQTDTSVRLGRTYRAVIQFNRVGDYEYRFRFADQDGEAVGQASGWQPGPRVLAAPSGAALLVGPLTATPTIAGAEIRFSLTDEARVTATVLGITGRPVRAIVTDQPLRAGDHVLLWDGNDERGLRAPGGVYLIRTEARATVGGQGQAVTTLRLP